MKISKLIVSIAVTVGLTGPGLAEEPQPVSQADLNKLVEEDPEAAFLHAFEAGDELTEAAFTSARGVGANVAEGMRFTRIPRADLIGDSEWANHLPVREGGPNATSCIACHSAPVDNGAGGVAVNVIVDPLHTGQSAQYLERNTLHLFALGAPQRIAEEMTTELQAQRDELSALLCQSGGEGETPLSAKSIAFGVIAGRAEKSGEECTVIFNFAEVSGIDEDLVVRPFGWKGNHATIRAFTRGAAHNELGLQAVELVGDTDGDMDGVVNELTIGDLTALSIYMAGLERPTSKIELAQLGLAELTDSEKSSIERGEANFLAAGCASCHVPEITLSDPIFQEPSAHPEFRETTLPSGKMAVDEGLDQTSPVRFDLTADQPNNRIESEEGEVRLGSFEKTENGEALIRWYSDFKRHDMGPKLSDPVDAFGYGASVWPTRSLAGVGSTGPWLHHGHATTLDEAIMAHGGEAEGSLKLYLDLAETEKRDLIAFLDNLVIYKHPSEEEEEH